MSDTPTYRETARLVLGTFLRSRRMRHRFISVAATTQSAVAEDAAVSIDLYARLERGTNIAVSVEALTRISRALGLSTDEERYARNLLVSRTPRVSSAPREIDDLAALAEALTPHPAFVLNHRWDIVASNRAFSSMRRVAGRASEENAVRTFFNDPTERRDRPDWESAADRMVAMLRMDFSSHVDDERFQALISDLERESRDFATRWQKHEVLSAATPVDGIVLDRRGRIRSYRCVPLNASGWDDLEIVVQIPRPM